MPTRRRSVDFIVPNRTPNRVEALLTITQTDPAQLDGLVLKGDELKLAAFGLTEDVCHDVEPKQLDQRLVVRLEAYEDRVVRASIDTVEPPGVSVVAAFYVSDTRAGALSGGITIVCTSPDYPKDLPSAPNPANPCPLVLAADLTCVDLGGDPGSPRGLPGVIEASRPQDLVVLVENAGPKDLTHALLYLEHTDNSGMTVVPPVWHLGTVEPGGRFWATCEIDARSAKPGDYEAVFVARSDHHEPTRLRARYRIPARNW